MNRNKRFAWTWAAAGVFAVAGLIGACDPEETDKPTPTADAGTQADAGSTADAGGNTDAGGTTDAGSTTDAGAQVDAGTDAGTETDAGVDAGPQSAFPLAVDGTWAPSGYMGDRGGITTEPTCHTPRPGAGLGACHKFTLTKGADGWGGVYWHYPEGNWGTQEGVAVPAGAKSVSFYAWGAEGGEAIGFFVGNGQKTLDKFKIETGDIVLNAVPTRYTIDISIINYGNVSGGFGWSAAGKDVPVVFFLDDIQWH
ncbi:hypothetical protein OV207_13095 [Corallococcus sp. BB11-1]|uniref:hypothetical protein n=1 Tax=Corallococcus sp. BB11-1 TaxID=2996783 RepID=UPI00226FB4CD|nr:hypothetical protein [Corallococcus sp. BB11-1]MCY1032401.1 hypothetical protein [Corallococcus sp. BB11-1]